MKLLLRLLINAVAIWAAAEIVPGVLLDMDHLGGVVVVALIFGVVNALLKPIIKFFSLPFIILTLGIFALVINAAMFGLTAWLTDALSVTGFWPAFWGSMIVAVVSWVLGLFLSDDD